jgi:5-methylcytosine-specific restriction endonuclease McrA
MMSVHGRLTGETVSWFNKNPAYSNQHCLYCGSPVGERATIVSDEEHLIGRNFVPTGTLRGGGFNFIFRSCRECNGRKGDLWRTRGNGERLAPGVD